MDMQNLKNAMESIEMPADMKARITQNCLTERSHETEERYMKKTKPLKRTFLIAAVLVLCLPVAGLAVKTSGSFKDIKNFFGAVTGTEYENATDEITVSLSAEENELLVKTTFVNPAAFPYKECEMLAIGSYKILDKTGNTVLEGTDTAPVTVTEGQALFYVALDDLENATYTMKIDSFISSKKADQPLPIYGNWELNFSL